MVSKELYTIGEISEICSTNPKTLRYYENMGLLKPEIKNPDTLYRYYSKDQMFTVFMIKKLQSFGFSLKEIKKLISADDSELYITEMSKKLQDIIQKLNLLKKTYMEGILFINKLGMKKERIDYFDMKTKNNGNSSLEEQLKNNEIQLEYINKISVLSTKKVMKNYNNIEISVNRWFEIYKLAESRELTVTGSIILIYHTENPMEQLFRSSCDLEILLPINEPDYDCDDIKEYGDFQAAVALHLGSYDTISSTHLKLLKWIDNKDLRLNGKISEEYIISPIDLKTQCGYITKIIAPVTKQ